MDMAKKVSALTSDYQLARALNVSTQRVSTWRTTDSVCDDDAALALAKLAKVRDEYALNLVAADRSKSSEARAVYLRAAERLAA